jgi:transposase
MAFNFVSGDREQLMLMPPSVADWLPEGHLAWFVIDTVDEFDLSEFLAGYRPDGRGGAAYSPAVMVALLVYAYAVGERSSRQIERRCVEDVAFRVVAANLAPDHATIARFRATHETALGALFGQVLGVCSRAGVLRPALIAVDGTKLGANASKASNRTAEQLAKDILKEAAEVDAAEDAADDGTPEMPADLAQRGPGRKARLRALLDELEAEAEAKSFDKHMAERAETEAVTGKKVRGRKPSADSARYRGRQQANTTDAESRLMKTTSGFVQGYNVQAAATEDQFIVAAEATNDPTDVGLLEPLVAASQRNLAHAGHDAGVDRVVADAGYWSEHNVALGGVETFIAPGKARDLNHIAEHDRERTAVLDRVEAGEIDRAQAATELGVRRARVNALLRRRKTPKPVTLLTEAIAKLDTPEGQEIYKKRSPAIEPVFAQIKHNRGMRTLSRRGLTAADSEWKLMAATHNLLKLWRLDIATA